MGTWLHKHRFYCIFRPFCLLAFVVLNAAHVVLHGTPLDGGALDAAVAQADLWLATGMTVSE